jgi:hypothetical protein
VSADPPVFVVRGGQFPTAEDVLIAVQDSYEDGEGAVASVYVGRQVPGEDLAQALRRICLEGRIPHGKIRVALESDLVEAGFVLVQDSSDGQPDCHHNVVFTEPPNIEQARLFLERFGEPMRNPAKD